MAPPEQLVFSMKFFVIAKVILLLALVIYACHWQLQKKVSVNITSPTLLYQQDTLYQNNKLFSGYLYALHPNGDTALIKSFHKGVEDGLTKILHPNKQMAEERFYREGKKVSVHRGWWPNGHLKFRYEFEDGEFNGTLKEWYENGTLFKTFHYLKGHEEGTQQLWWINGKIRSNYVIKNNRRYGLLGTKNCVNVADSIPFKL